MAFWRIIFISFYSVSVLSQSIEKITVTCSGWDQDCREMKEKIHDLFELPMDRESFRENLKFIVQDSAIQNHRYEFDDGKNSEVKINLSLRERIGSVTLSFDQNINVDEEDILRLIPLKKNVFFDREKLEESKRNIVEFLETRGFNVSGIEVETSTQSGLRIVHFNVGIDSKVLVEDIDINVDLKTYKDELLRSFLEMKNMALNTVSLQSRVQQLINQFSQEGFLYANGEYFLKKSRENTVIVNIRFVLGTEYRFNFHGNKRFSHQDLSDLVEQITRKKKEFPENTEIIQALMNHYEQAGIYNSKITVRTTKGVTKFNIPFSNVYIDIDEGHFININEVFYNGVSSISIESVKKLFHDKASPLVQRGLMDRDFLGKFSSQIKEEYLKKGFVFARVLGPVYKKLSNDSYNIVYDIIEGRQNILREINIDGVSEELDAEIRNIMENKEGEPVNIMVLEKDLDQIQKAVKKKGFYFAKITNLQDNIIGYSDALDTSSLHIVFDLGYKSFFGKSLIFGNRKTEQEVIEREIRPYYGNIATLEQIQEIQNNLVTLGLFSNVSITPVIVKKDDEKKINTLNLLVQVTERPFGLGELGPGFRNDLGFKTDFIMTYNNLWGLNHIVSTTTQVNRRTNSDELNEKRRGKEANMLEGFFEIKYSVPYWLYGILFDSKWEFEIESAFKRERTYNFDTDILTIGSRISKKITDYFLISMHHQFESIRQFNATEFHDDETFKAGVLMPSLVLDFRDNDIFPTKGAYFGFFLEYSNEYFGPQSGNNVKIDYSKFTLRNRFYYPIEDWVMVMAISGGHQKNYVHEVLEDEAGRRIVGHIPSIKVFRLSGIDNVRGHDDTELNRLGSGEDISDVRIQDAAYFVNYKIEPRYKVSDNFILNFFVDAGNIYINTFRPFTVKSSFGAGVKFLTPVGTLDFDYGIKLQKRTYQGGRVRDSFGRFHLTIGSF